MDKDRSIQGRKKFDWGGGFTPPIEIRSLSKIKKGKESVFS